MRFRLAPPQARRAGRRRGAAGRRPDPDGAGQVADHLHVVRPKEELRRTVGSLAGGEIERVLIEPHFALLDLDREHARFLR